MLEITHPYHPLCGKKYKILKVRTINSSNIYSIQIENNVISVHE